MRTALSVSEFPPPVFAGFLQGDPMAARVVVETLGSLLRRWTRRAAPRLSRDLVDDVVQETWLIALRRGEARFRAAGCEVVPYLFGLFRNAIQSVRAAYRQAGTRSRHQGEIRDRQVPRRLHHPIVGIEPWESDDEIEAHDWVEGRAVSRAELELIRDAAARIERRQDAMIDLSLLAGRSGPAVRDAIHLLCEEQITTGEAALRVGLTRQTLGRRLRELAPAA
jgi:DNA-directed RNA polymerase specialized sigma24 family protein